MDKNLSPSRQDAKKVRKKCRLKPAYLPTEVSVPFQYFLSKEEEGLEILLTDCTDNTDQRWENMDKNLSPSRQDAKMMIKRKPLLIIMLLLLAVGCYGQFGKNKVQVNKLHWSVIETLHFDIYYPRGADEFGKKAALMTEEAYYYLQEAFQAPVSERIPIIFYESHKEFQVTNIIYPLLIEGIGGFTEGLRNRIVVPYDGSYKKLEETLIHELTHAYINILDNELQSSRFFNIQRMAFPFWFSEGLPEYLSIGGEDNYNNIFVMDMIFNSYLAKLEEVGGYHAYRLGESFLSYIDEAYGRNAVMQFFFATKMSGNMDSASLKVFGMSFEDIQKRWRNHLFRSYTDYLNTHTVPYEVYDKRTDHKQQNSYFNFSPRFAPDGNSYLYFSNRNQRMSIWRGLTIDIFEDNLVMRGETTGKFEQFHFLRSNISWFPDGERFAFVAKTKAGDVIYTMDVATRKVVDSYEMFDFDAVYEIDICKAGEKVAFSGQRNMSNNIYYMDLQSGDVTQVTDDAYYDHQPRWSPDGSRIVFSSERLHKRESKYEHLFNRLTDQVFFYDLAEQQFYQVTDDQFSNSAPMWNSTGEKIIFISEEDNIANFQIIDINTGKRAAVTKTLAGVFKGDINASDDMLVFSVFYENGWNVYLHRNPLENLQYYDYAMPARTELEDNFSERFSLYRYRFYGRNDELLVSKDEEKVIERYDTIFYRIRRNVALHPKPLEINEPVIEPYKVKFYLDRLWGGVSYSSVYGTVGNLQIGMSDMMGDHTIGIQLGIADSFKNSDIVFTYLNLSRRIDLGGGGFYLNDDYIVYFPVTDDYLAVRVRDAGLLNLVSYPFDRFWRLDFENVLYHRRERYEIWNRWLGEWQDAGEIEGFVYTPQVKLVQDNILYGPTGPMTGWRGYLSFSHTYAEVDDDYYAVRSDLRNYTLFARNYSFAQRLFLAKTDSIHRYNKFRLDGNYGVRGNTDTDRGQNKALCTFELRFPFIDRLNMQFPLPMSITNIRGSFFTDIGAVWDNHDDFRPMKDGVLNDLVLGFGMGPRINLGYFVLKFDTAWRTDLSRASKPTYYISINEEF